MLGEGIVSFGVAFWTVSRRNAKCSPKIVRGRVTVDVTWADGGAQSYSLSSFSKCTWIVSSWTFVIPPSW
jgi:hypothetical protein